MCFTPKYIVADIVNEKDRVNIITNYPNLQLESRKIYYRKIFNYKIIT